VAESDSKRDNGAIIRRVFDRAHVAGLVLDKVILDPCKSSYLKTTLLQWRAHYRGELSRSADYVGGLSDHVPSDARAAAAAADLGPEALVEALKARQTNVPSKRDEDDPARCKLSVSGAQVKLGSKDTVKAAAAPKQAALIHAALQSGTIPGERSQMCIARPNFSSSTRANVIEYSLIEAQVAQGIKGYILVPLNAFPALHYQQMIGAKNNATAAKPILTMLAGLVQAVPNMHERGALPDRPIVPLQVYDFTPGDERANPNSQHTPTSASKKLKQDGNRGATETVLAVHPLLWKEMQKVAATPEAVGALVATWAQRSLPGYGVPGIYWHLAKCMFSSRADGGCGIAPCIGCGLKHVGNAFSTVGKSSDTASPALETPTWLNKKATEGGDEVLQSLDAAFKKPLKKGTSIEPPPTNPKVMYAEGEEAHEKTTHLKDWFEDNKESLNTNTAKDAAFSKPSPSYGGFGNAIIEAYACACGVKAWAVLKQSSHGITDKDLILRTKGAIVERRRAATGKRIRREAPESGGKKKKRKGSAGPSAPLHEDLNNTTYTAADFEDDETSVMGL